MPKGTENVQEAPPKGKENVQETPLKGTESIYSVPPYNTESHQPLYSEEILIQKVNEDWEGFNS